MKISKGSIEYDGKKYPTVDVELSREEVDKHNECMDLVFADIQLYNDLCKDGEPDWNNYDDPRVDVDNKIFFYADNNVCADYCNGKIGDGEMKFKVGRMILSLDD